jgi:hypothetical protein
MEIKWVDACLQICLLDPSAIFSIGVSILIFLVPAGAFHSIILASQALHLHHIIQL